MVSTQLARLPPNEALRGRAGTHARLWRLLRGKTSALVPTDSAALRGGYGHCCQAPGQRGGSSPQCQAGREGCPEGRMHLSESTGRNFCYEKPLGSAHPCPTPSRERHPVSCFKLEKMLPASSQEMCWPNPAAAGARPISDTLLTAHDPHRGYEQLGYRSENTPLSCGKVTHRREPSLTLV